MDFITIFGITLKINRIAFTLPILGGWSVYWYGIIIAAGVFTALFYGMKNGERLGMKPDDIFDAFIVVLPCSIIAARAYYIIFDPNGSSFKDFFSFNNHQGFSGLAIYGGVIGAAITIFIMQKIKKFSFLAALDVTSIGFLIGQGIGRWGNFFNQEAYGTFTGSNWFGMTGSIISSEMGSDALVHPCFLYESIWCIAGAFLLHYLSKKRIFKGQVALMYGVWYGFERTFIELLRTDSLMIGNVRVSSLLSAILCVGCTVTLIILTKKFKANKAPEYEAQFTDINELTYSNNNADVDGNTENNADVINTDNTPDLKENDVENNSEKD